MNNDQQERTNRRTLIDPQNMQGPFERAFFKTVAGPGSTAYPADGLSPPTSVYYCRRLKNVRYTKTPGPQTLNSDDTTEHEYVFNLEPAKYIEPDSKIWGFKMGAQWFTIDKTPGNFVTHRKYDVDGNLLWSKDHGATVYDIVVDGSGSVYVVGEEAADGAYVRRYTADGTLNLSIPRGDHLVSGPAGIAVDGGGNILVQSFLSTRKFNSSGVQQWESTNSGGYGIAIGDSDSYYISTQNVGLAKYSSAGAFIRYAAETDQTTKGRRLSSRVSESTVANSGSGRWNTALTTEFTLYRYSECMGVDHSGSSTWYSGFITGDLASAAKSSANFGVFPAVLVEDWRVPQRGTAGEWDCALFASGEASLLVCGDRYSNITHQARDSTTGSLLWERDHGARVYCCAGASDSVVIGGERVTA